MPTLYSNTPARIGDVIDEAYVAINDKQELLFTIQMEVHL